MGLVAATVASLLAPTVAARAQGGPDLRINEFSSAGPAGASDDFIELANWGDQPASMDGWTLYRCAGSGSRAYASQVPTFGDITLAPGETYLVAHQNSEVAGQADTTYGTSLANSGSGVWLAGPDGTRVDSVAMYSAPADSECGIDGGVLPNTLDYGRAQTYQRVAITGDNARDYIAAGRTPDAANAQVPDPGVQPSLVRVTELTNGGPAGSSDNFVEIVNLGDETADIGDWVFSRCIGSGLRYRTTRQATVPAGTELEPGEVLVFAHTSTDTSDVPADVDVLRYSTSLANAGFGAILEDAQGNVREAVAVYDGVDSPCTQGQALPNQLDYGFDETWQRFRDTGVNADDFLKRTRTIGTHVPPDPTDEPEPEPFAFAPVRITEVAPAGPDGASDGFFELANEGKEPVNLAGWSAHRCAANGRRAIAPQVADLGDVTLAPGETYVAANARSALAATADATYEVSFADAGFGLVVFDADMQVVDRVGLYRAGAAPSWCTKGLAYPNHLDTAAGSSAQRLATTGDDSVDLVEAPRTPGSLPDDLRRPEDPTDEALTPVDVPPPPRPERPALLAPEDGATVDGTTVDLQATMGHTAGDDMEVTVRGARRLELQSAATRTFTGVSGTAPPTTRRTGDEDRIGRDAMPIDGTDAPPLVTEARDGFPYQRFELAVGDPGADMVEVAWHGRSTGANELQLYVWDRQAEAWQLLDAATGTPDRDEVVTLLGRVDVAAAAGRGRIDVLVQDGPATQAAFGDDADEPNGAFKQPEEYDASLAFVTDTQFLSQMHEDAFTAINSWIVANQDARRIGYTAHTGDIVQTWLNGPHPEAVARDEFEFASDVMAILDDADHPYGVTPGNHDNKWGRANELYNEYFGPGRYEDRPWYGGAWREDDNQNHYDVIDLGGLPVLVLYVGYFGGEEAIDWANEVLAAHPDHNVIFATHEYINTEGALTSPDNYRWTSLGQRYFDEIVLPNDNVFLVLSGHFHGVALNIKRDVGGVEDRTVVEMLADYQGFRRDGRRDTGFFRLLQFDHDSRTVGVNTFSPSLEEHNADEYDTAGRYVPADDEFTIEVDLNDRYRKRVVTERIGLQETTAETALTKTSAGNGDTVTVTWDGLDAGTSYGWYVEATGPEGVTRRSPVSVFTTSGQVSPGRR